MHARFSYQDRLPTLPTTSRNKPHPKPWPESPAASSPVSFGRVADGPPDMVGRSARSRPNQQSLCTISSLSKFERRTVRLTHADGPRVTQRPCFHPETVRDSPADGPPLGPPFRPDGPLPSPDNPHLPVQHSCTHS